MALLTPPNEFMRRLKLYDDALDCRWSDLRSVWLIERAVPENSTLRGGQGYVDAEDHLSASNRKIILFEVDRNALDERVFYSLWSTDIRRQGGAEAVNDAIDTRYLAAIAKNKAHFRDLVRGHAKERWRYLNTVRTVPEHAAHTAPDGGMSINAD